MNDRFKNGLALSLVLLLSGSIFIHGQKPADNGDLKHWPKGSSPQEVGKRIAERERLDREDGPLRRALLDHQMAYDAERV